MTPKQFVKPAGAVAAVALLGFAGMSITSPRAQADSSESDSRVQIGFALAPVMLNMHGKNPALVGKGSYIVNAQGDCNGCHNSPGLGGEWVAGHNPFFGQPKMINAAGYLGGGTPFGPFTSRNLTPGCSTSPCNNPLPEGGHSFQDFLTILRTGKDFDLAHPAISKLLQVMPWPVYGNMSDDDIRAIYEYLSAIPCISHAGEIGLPANLYQFCP